MRGARPVAPALAYAAAYLLMPQPGSDNTGMLDAGPHARASTIGLITLADDAIRRRLRGLSPLAPGADRGETRKRTCPATNRVLRCNLAIAV